MLLLQPIEKFVNMYIRKFNRSSTLFVSFSVLWWKSWGNVSSRKFGLAAFDLVCYQTTMLGVRFQFRRNSMDKSHKAYDGMGRFTMSGNQEAGSLIIFEVDRVQKRTSCARRCFNLIRCKVQSTLHCPRKCQILSASRPRENSNSSLWAAMLV